MFKFIKGFSYALLLIGGLNWGLVGLFEFDLVSFLFGEMTVFSRIVYSLVGVCTVLYAILAFIDDNSIEEQN